jgi:decaprenylphospho-beta-D-erythro-pentofuranosid-2-ulose 2-reductase
VIGATSAIAAQCVRLWIQEQPVDVTLVGRDTGRMERVAADMQVRSAQSSFSIVQADFSTPAAIQRVADDIAARGPLDIVLIAHGSLPNQADCESDLQACYDALLINALSPALYAEAFANHLARNNRGTLVLIGSVAGDRGRKSNYAYGAAKGLVTRYAQGLQHRFAGTGVKVVLIKPGPTDTPMTAHLKGQGAKLAPVQEVAQKIVSAVARGRAVAYIPGKWRLIMGVIQHLPSFVFNKMNI